MPINSEVMESFIKSTPIFDNVNITSKPYIIKVFPKSNIVIVWIDIWDSQSGLTAKTLINCCFNTSSFVTTIHSMNMISSIQQCKNCWKWEHTTFMCCFQDVRYLKYNSFQKVKHNCHFTWCYKANFKINLLYLETKQGKPCFLSQIRYSLVVILELNGGSEVQYKNMMMVDDGKYQ